MPKRRAGPTPILLLFLATLVAHPSAQAPAVPPAATPAPLLVPVWSLTLPAPPAAQPAFDASHAFVALQDGQVAAVALDRGEVAWTVKADTAALAAGDGLVFLAAPDAIEARAAANGRSKWRFETGTPLAAALYWDGGWLLAATLQGEILMLRAADGAELWRQPLGTPPSSGAAMTGDRVYMLAGDRVLARRLADGAPIWERRLGGRATTLRALDDRVFVGGDDKFLYCLDAEDGDERWRWRTGGAVTGTPEVDEDHVYFLALDNVLRALDRGNGHQRWMRPLGFRPSGGPFALDGLLLVSTLSPELALFGRQAGAPAGSITASADPAAPPHLVAAHSPGAVADSVIVLARTGVLDRLGPPPPPLEAKPVPGLPAYVTVTGTSGKVEGKT